MLFVNLKFTISLRKTFNYNVLIVYIYHAELNKSTRHHANKLAINEYQTNHDKTKN